MENVIHSLADGVAVARRNVIRIRRVPEILFAVAVTPLVFLALFAYVFGGSIDIPGGSYREFLIGGTFAQILVFGDLHRRRSGRGHAEGNHRQVSRPAHVAVGSGVRQDS